MPAREESAANVNAESPVTSDLDEALDHLRAAYRESGKTLDETLQADFQRLFSAADQLRQLDRSRCGHQVAGACGGAMSGVLMRMGCGR